MNKRLKVALTLAAAGFFNSTLAASEPIPYRVEVPSPEVARKVAISFHHAVLETNYKENYLILDLSKKEIEMLKTFNLQAKLDKQWQSRYNEHNKRIQSAIKNAKNSEMTGIPGYECYPTVEETFAQASELASNNSGITEWIDVGDSWTKQNAIGGYDLMVLKITNKSIQQDKPKLFIHSAMHAREYTTAALTLDFAKQLLDNYENNADYKWIIDYHEIHIMFHMNPDGRKIAEGGAYQRKNTNRNHCPGDDVGVDLNRNFAFFWNSTVNGSSGNACDSTYRGPEAESEPETKAVSNYIRSLFPDARGPGESDAAPEDTPGMHLDIHSYSELVLWPWGHTSSSSPNNAAFVELGSKLAWFNNYTPQQSVGLYPTDGTSDDVSYGELGIAAFTFELGTSFFQQCSTYNTQIKPDNLPALFYSAKVAAAPYKLSFGPEVTGIKIDGSDSEATVIQGANVSIEVTADANRTKKIAVDRKITKVEYSVDTPIWLESATKIELTEDDGALNSGVETLRGQLDTSELSLGQHTIFAQAYNEDNKVGVPTAVYIQVSNNATPTADFTFDCTDLTCQFDGTASNDSDGNIQSYEWNFGDGNSATSSSTQHTFSQAGSYSVTLTVTDDQSGEGILSKSVNVTAPPSPPAPPPVSRSSGGGAMIWSLILISLFRIRTK